MMVMEVIKLQYILLKHYIMKYFKTIKYFNNKMNKYKK